MTESDKKPDQVKEHTDKELHEGAVRSLIEAAGCAAREAIKGMQNENSPMLAQEASALLGAATAALVFIADHSKARGGLRDGGDGQVRTVATRLLRAVVRQDCVLLDMATKDLAKELGLDLEDL